MQESVLSSDPIETTRRADVQRDRVFERFRRVLDAGRDRQHLIRSNGHIPRRQMEPPRTFQHHDYLFAVVRVRLSDCPLHYLDSCDNQVVTLSNFSRVELGNALGLYFVPIVKPHIPPVMLRRLSSLRM